MKRNSQVQVCFLFSFGCFWDSSQSKFVFSECLFVDKVFSSYKQFSLLVVCTVLFTVQDSEARKSVCVPKDNDICGVVEAMSGERHSNISFICDIRQYIKYANKCKSNFKTFSNCQAKTDSKATILTWWQRFLEKERKT